MDVHLGIMSWISGQKQMSHRSDAVTEVSKNIVQLEKNRNFVLCVHNSSYIQEINNHLFIYLFKRQVKSHLAFAGIIRSSPFSPR
jgi:hypothetical protein